MSRLVSCILSILSLIFISILPIDAQSRGRIGLNQILRASKNGPSWLSPKGDFAFGFQPYPNTTNLFLLAIWYAKIPDTIVWYPIEANYGNPIPEESTVTLSDYVGLVLKDPKGTPIWNTTLDGLIPGFVGHGFLDDSGNLILINKYDEKPLWQSFDHPVDTLLPTQVMEPNSSIYSRLTEANFTMGRIQMSFFADGRLVFFIKDPVTNFSDIYFDYYYNNYTIISTENSNSGQKLVYNENYIRATLNFNGVFTWYYHPRNFTEKNVTWNILKSIPDDPNEICSYIPLVGRGICGYNSICSIDKEYAPTCTCPESYSLIDPKDRFGDCEPDHEIGFCGKNAYAKKGLAAKPVQLQGIDWPTQDYATRNCTEEVCKSWCQYDCFCAVSIYERSSSSCWKKKLPLSGGKNISNVTRIAWLKVGNGSDSIRNKRLKVVEVLLGFSVSVNLFLLIVIGFVVFFLHHKIKLRKFGRSHKSHNKTLEYSNIKSFSYQELTDATNEFKEELGKGAFGIVYKGMIETGGPAIFIAVKKLDRITEDANKEFKTEVEIIGQTHHRNLVRLVGFCKEEDHRLLVYEYMSNGNLANYLFGEIRPSWMTRIQIAQGIARGLSYLHEECSTQIIHCDIKPQNVLLDANHNARIADFGLAKLLALNQTYTVTMIRGTKGYVAPEWFRNKPVTAKVDVYSFGILLLEIICCRKSVSMELINEERAILTDWAFDCYQSNALDRLVNDDNEALDDHQQFKKYVYVALWCIQEEPNVRPTMKRVIQMLEGVAVVPSPPCPASYSIATQF